MRATEFTVEDDYATKIAQGKQQAQEYDRQLTVYEPAEEDPWLKDPEMAQARKEKRRYVDKDGRIWNFDQNDIGFKSYQGLRKPKNIPGVNFKPVDLVGQTVYHCTNKISAIQKHGGLKPVVDRTGENEYGRQSTHWDPFIPVKAIWVTTANDVKWAGKHCVSFEILPTDKVGQSYGVGYVILNPIPWDRLTVEEN